MSEIGTSPAPENLYNKESNENKKLVGEIEKSLKDGSFKGELLENNDVLKMKVIKAYPELSLEGKLGINKALIEIVQKNFPNYKKGASSLKEYGGNGSFYAIARMKPENLMVKVEQYDKGTGRIEFGNGTDMSQLLVDVDAFQKEQIQKSEETAKKYRNTTEVKPMLNTSAFI